MRVPVGGRPVEVTPTEFQLLQTLIREPGRVFTRAQLLDAVHGVAIESYERAIDAHVSLVEGPWRSDPRTQRVRRGHHDAVLAARSEELVAVP